MKSYRHYLKKLKERFGEIKQVPSDDDVRAFIKQYIWIKTGRLLFLR